MCTIVVHSDAYTRKPFLNLHNLHIALGVDLVFVCLFRFVLA